MKKIITILTLVLAFAMVAGVASAAVTFDENTGAGFVGKGDVQQPWGWNNAQMNAKAAGVSFTHETADRYIATCTWITGLGTKGQKTHNVDIPRTTQVFAAVAHEARRNVNGNLTGFILTGFGNSTTTGVIPVVGGPCPGNGGNGGTYTEVSEPVSLGGGLYAHHPEGASLLIWPAAS